MRDDDRTLGSLLRHLIDLLDADVQSVYDSAALPYRPRFTPVVKAIARLGPASIRAIADESGMTHSAVSQTVAQMVRAGLVDQRPGRDGRERIVRPTDLLAAILPRVRALWAATNGAAAALDDELAYPLSRLALEAIQALEARSFGARIAAAEPVS